MTQVNFYRAIQRPIRPPISRDSSIDFLPAIRPLFAHFPRVTVFSPIGSCRVAELPTCNETNIISLSFEARRSSTGRRGSNLHGVCFLFDSIDSRLKKRRVCNYFRLTLIVSSCLSFPFHFGTFDTNESAEHVCGTIEPRFRIAPCLRSDLSSVAM